MGAFAKAITNFIHLGGTGVPWTSTRDIVIGDLTPGGEFKVGGITISADKAMGFIPFFAAVRNISEDVAGLPLNVYRDTQGGGKEKDPSHPVHKLLHSAANPYMTAFTFRETLQAHVLTWGNGYAEIEFATDGSILALWPLRPDRVTVFVDRAIDAVVYRVALPNGERKDLPRRKVFHVHGLGYDGLVGYSVIEKARHTIGMALGAEKYGEDHFARGGIPPAYLSHPKELSPKGRENLRKSIDDGTLTDRNRMALLEEGMDIKTLGIPPRDSAFLETLTDGRSLTATLFRMPPDMLQDVTRSTSWGTGIEQQGIGYVKYTLRGHLSRWEQEGNTRLLSGEDRYLKHLVDGLMRGDVTARWNSYRQGLDLGVYSIDDVLELEDRNPLPNGLGQQHFVQLNRAPLEQIGEMTMAERLAALGGLVRAGYTPDAATDALDLPDIDHTGFPPVTVLPVPTSGNGKSLGGEVRCGNCNRLLAEHASSPYRMTCSRCKSVTEVDDSSDRLDELADRLDTLPARIAAAMPPGQAPEVHIHEGAIKAADVYVTSPPVNVHPPEVVIHLPEQRPVKRTVARDAKGQIATVTEEPV